MSKPDPMTQCERILAYLRKHKRATNMELVQRLWIASPWTRIGEMVSPRNGVVWPWVSGREHWPTERITRTTIKTKSGKRVTQYRLERV